MMKVFLLLLLASVAYGDVWIASTFMDPECAAQSLVQMKVTTIGCRSYDGMTSNDFYCNNALPYGNFTSLTCSSSTTCGDPCTSDILVPVAPSGICAQVPFSTVYARGDCMPLYPAEPTGFVKTTIFFGGMCLDHNFNILNYEPAGVCLGTYKYTCDYEAGTLTREFDCDPGCGICNEMEYLSNCTEMGMGYSCVPPPPPMTTVEPGSSSIEPGSSTVEPGSSTAEPGSSSLVAPGSSTAVPGSSSLVAPGSSSLVAPGSSSRVTPGSSSRVTPGSSSITPLGSSSLGPKTSVTPGAASTDVPPAVDNHASSLYVASFLLAILAIILA